MTTDKNITIKNLQTRKKEVEEELEYKPEDTSLNEELYEIKDTLKELKKYKPIPLMLFRGWFYWVFDAWQY